jgi:hypothetical protein
MIVSVQGHRLELDSMPHLRHWFLLIRSLCLSVGIERVRNEVQVCEHSTGGDRGLWLYSSG